MASLHTQENCSSEVNSDIFYHDLGTLTCSPSLLCYVSKWKEWKPSQWKYIN